MVHAFHVEDAHVLHVDVLVELETLELVVLGEHLEHEREVDRVAAHGPDAVHGVLVAAARRHDALVRDDDCGVD